jgi:hypothetical protein
MEAVKRSASVALKFEKEDGDYAYAAYVDGNANGIRTLDIRTGVDAGGRLLRVSCVCPTTPSLGGGHRAGALVGPVHNRLSRRGVNDPLTQGRVGRADAVWHF